MRLTFPIYSGSTSSDDDASQSCVHWCNTKVSRLPYPQPCLMDLFSTFLSMVTTLPPMFPLVSYGADSTVGGAGVGANFAMDLGEYF